MLLDRFRGTPGVADIEAVARNADEKTVAAKLKRCARRAWTRNAGNEPSDEQLATLFRGVYVQLLDVDDDQAAADQATEILRTQLLQRPAEAHLAWSALVELASQCHERRTEFSGAVLAHQLRQLGVALQSPPDYRRAIQILQRLTHDSIDDARRFTELNTGDASTAIARDIAGPLHDAAQDGHLLVVGEPGAGKSGLLCQLTSRLAHDGAPVVPLCRWYRSHNHG